MTENLIDARGNTIDFLTARQVRLNKGFKFKSDALPGDKTLPVSHVDFGVESERRDYDLYSICLEGKMTPEEFRSVIETEYTIEEYIRFADELDSIKQYIDPTEEDIEAVDMNHLELGDAYTRISLVNPERDDKWRASEAYILCLYLKMKGVQPRMRYKEIPKLLTQGSP